MAQETDILWGMYQENTTQGRHHEDQRAAMTNLVVAICAGVLGLFALDKGPAFIHIVLSAFLVVLGVFGAIFSAKHYERFSMHNERARGYRDAVEALLPGTHIKESRNARMRGRRRSSLGSSRFDSFASGFPFISSSRPSV